MSFTEFTCRNGGSNLNAGATSGAGEEGTAALFSAVGDSDGTSVFTPSDGSTPAATVSAGMFGSVYITAGAAVTVFVGRITSVAAGANGAVTFSTTAKSGTFPAASGGAHTISLKVGGAWKGPNGADGFPKNFITSSLANAAGNPPFVNYKNDQTYSVTAQISVPVCGVVGHGCYAATFRDGGRATLDGGTSGASYHLLSLGSALGAVWQDWIFQNNGASGTADLMRSAVGVRVARCVFAHSRGNGFNGSNCSLAECEAYDCNQSNTSNQAGFNTVASALVRCVSHDNAGSNSFGFYSTGSTFDTCVADTNGASGWKLDQSGNNQTTLVRCAAYNNAADGALVGNNAQAAYLESCAFVLNGAFGFRDNSGAVVTLQNCAFYLNTSGQVSSASGYTTNAGAVTLAGNPFTDPANGDFRLNATAGAGAACRAAGRGTFTQTAAAYAGTASSPDIGAAQHPDPTQPAVGNVRSGTAYNDGASTGTMTEPATTDVRSGVHYGAGGTEFTGTYAAACDYPPAGDVEAGVVYSSGALVGTFAVPNPSDVKAGIGYGALGVEFDGTFRGVVGAMPQLQVPTEPKEVARVRLYVFDFHKEPEIVAGETLVTPTIPAVTGLTISAPAITTQVIDGVPAGQGVAATISGGSAGVVYLVECRCTTSGGATLVRRMYLSVE